MDSTAVVFKQSGLLFRPTLIEKKQIDTIEIAVRNNKTFPPEVLGFWDKLCSLFWIETDKKLAAEKFFTLLNSDTKLQNAEGLALSNEDKQQLQADIIAACDWLLAQIVVENHAEFAKVIQKMTGNRVTVEFDDIDKSIKSIDYPFLDLDVGPLKQAPTETEPCELIDHDPEYDKQSGKIASSLLEIADSEEINEENLKSNLKKCFTQDKIGEALTIIEQLAMPKETDLSKIAASRIVLINRLLTLAKGDVAHLITIETVQLKDEKVRVRVNLLGVPLTALKCNASSVAASLHEYKKLLQVRSYFKPGHCAQAFEIIAQISAEESAESNVGNFTKLVTMVKANSMNHFQLAIVEDTQAKGIKITLPNKELICDDSKVAACLSLFSPEHRLTA